MPENESSPVSSSPVTASSVSPSARLAELVELVVRVEKIVMGGDGLARNEGMPLFIPRAAPGDLLRVRVVERRSDYGRAEIVKILEPGEGRREPPCPHFATCGGCDLQHLEDSVQLRVKALAVRETLRRLGGLENVRFEILAGEAWGYRLRHQLQVGDTDRGRRVGYFARASHELVPIDVCPILVPELESKLKRWPLRVREVEHRRLDVVAGDDESWGCSPVVEDVPHGELTITVGDFSYLLDAGCFFQGHRGLLPRFVDNVIGDGEGETAIDLYAGVGLFSLPLARRYGKVISVEGDRTASRYARKNAQRHGFAKLETVHQSVDSWVDALPAGIDRVVVDPPRGGLAQRVTEMLLARRPKRLTYVSCHPATLARDLKSLRKGFELVSLTLVDMFPQTGHMEVVAQLEINPDAPAGRVPSRFGFEVEQRSRWDRGRAERRPMQREDRPPRRRDDDDRPPRPRRDDGRPPRRRPDGDRPPRPRRDGEDRPPRRRRDEDRPPRPRRDDDRPPRPRRDEDRPPRRPDRDDRGGRPFRPERPQGERPRPERPSQDPPPWSSVRIPPKKRRDDDPGDGD